MDASDPPGPPAGAAARRRATDDPNVFVIPTGQVPPNFAEHVDDPAHVPVTPRPAATVVLLREAPGGLEALLLRRHRRAGFAADAWVFPGGVVDAADADPALHDRLDGPSPGEWAERLGIGAEEALGYVSAAIREAFEETGILLAHPDGVAERPADEEAQLETARRALLNGVVGLREVAVNQGLRLAGDALLYLAHWITPEPEPRRYDTRFFAACVPADAPVLHHEAELTDAAWLPPAEAVARFRAGAMKLLPPTVHTLARLAAFASWDEVRRALAEAPVPVILPTLRRHPDGIAIVLPDR